MSLNSNPVNILIVDDEKKACINLKNILHEFVDPDLNILGFAHNTTEAEAKIRELKPDTVFLDIEMPNENAFQFLERIAPVSFDVIFVTAYDEYAVRAFRFNALDYILKPISISELNTAVAKLKDKIRYRHPATDNAITYTELAEQVQNKAKQHKITLRDSNEVEIVEFRNICYVEAQGSYSKISFLKNAEIKEMLLSGPLSEYEELLPDTVFYRIHRSYLVNCGLINTIINTENILVILSGNITLPVSRRRLSPFIDFLKHNDFHYE